MSLKSCCSSWTCDLPGDAMLFTSVDLLLVERGSVKKTGNTMMHVGFVKQCCIMS